MQSSPTPPAGNSFLSSLSTRLAHWPWWAIIIFAGLIMLFYSFATSSLYRRVLQFVTDDPRASTTGYPRVGYDVKSGDATVTVRGIQTAEDESTVTVETQTEVQVDLPSPDIGSIICAQPDANGKCAINDQVTVTRAFIAGTLILEDLGKYQIKTDYGDTIDVRKIGVNKDKETRIPAGCSPDVEGRCRIELILLPDAKENQITGKLLENTTEQVTVQTKPPISQVINKADIAKTQYKLPDSQCALNNPAGCDEGPFVTIGITISVFIIAVIIGLIFGLMRISSNPLLFNISTIYVEVMRGVPLLVILLFVSAVFAPWFRDNFPPVVPLVQGLLIVIGIIAAVIVYFRARAAGSPNNEIVPQLIAVVIAFGLLILFVTSLRVNPLSDLTQRAILGLSLGYGAFLTELFRAGIQSVGRGQMEAARSLGMNYVESMRHVVLPQAFRLVLPPLGNEFIAILKDSSLAAVIGVPELTQKARLFGAATYRVFEAYITIGALYLCMTLFLSFLVRTVEKRLAITSR